MRFEPFVLRLRVNDRCRPLVIVRRSVSHFLALLSRPKDAPPRNRPFRPSYPRVMMKKKLVSALVVFAGLIAFSQTDAQARPHHKHHRHSIHHTAHKHHVGHVRDGARRHYRRTRVHAARVGRGRPSAWCGWWLGQQLGMPRRDLWLARNWASVGHNAGGPRIGAVVVWRHHVGIITGRAGSKWVVKSGNDGHAVRERPRSISGAIAFRSLGGGSSRS